MRLPAARTRPRSPGGVDAPPGRARLLPLVLAGALVVAVAGCGSGSGDACDLSGVQWSTSSSGGLCTVNFFGDVEYLVSCSPNGDGTWTCRCGRASDNPPEFTSDDFCELDGPDRACAAIEACGFPL